MIRLDEVSKEFQQGGHRVHALDSVSLQIPRGQFLSIMGPSGSGKSTLLHLVGGLDVPTRGEIVIEGLRLSTMTDDQITLFRRRHLGFVFQAFNLLPTLTAEENVALPLLLEGLPGREVRARVGRVLALTDLAPRRRHHADALSGGEMQRVAVARALVIDPVVILADEPTGNLDSESGARVLAALHAAAGAGGCTVIMVTHDPHAAAVGDRVVTLRDGRLVGDRPPGAALAAAGAE